MPLHPTLRSFKPKQKYRHKLRHLSTGFFPQMSLTEGQNQLLLTLSVIICDVHFIHDSLCSFRIGCTSGSWSLCVDKGCVENLQVQLYRPSWPWDGHKYQYLVGQANVCQAKFYSGRKRMPPLCYTGSNGFVIWLKQLLT